MIVAQVVLEDATEYERKCQRIDAASLPAAGYTITDEAAAAEIVHVYAGRKLPALRFTPPFVANIASTRRRFSLRRESNPAAVVTPFNVSEAVEDRYFNPVILSRRSGEAVERSEGPVAETDDSFQQRVLRRPPLRSAAQDDRERKVTGSFARPSIQTMIEQTMHRIDRFRDDMEWRLFSHPPSPEEFADLAVWVDPAVEEDDFDGFVAEALACGVNVVAAGTSINVQRLEKGRTGFLVPPRDPNEMTHAILTALFKPELTRARSEAARQTVAKFRAGQRIRALTRIYESIVQ